MPIISMPQGKKSTKDTPSTPSNSSSHVQDNDYFQLLLTRLTDSFTDSINKLIDSFTVALTKSFDDKFSLLSSRLDMIEAKLTSHSVNASSNVGHNCNGTSVAEIVSKTLMDMEKERSELKEKSFNIIVSGLNPISSISDKDLIEQFCEENLTVKPAVLSTRRIGSSSSSGLRLCATLDSAESVQSVLSSSTTLRRSSNPNVNSVFFNPDLTKAQQAAAYKARCQRRERLMQARNITASISQSGKALEGHDRVSLNSTGLGPATANGPATSALSAGASAFAPTQPFSF